MLFLIMALLLAIRACTPVVKPPSLSPESDEIADPKIQVRLTPVLDHLRFPIGLNHGGDQSGRLFVILQAGQIRVLRNGKLEPKAFLDIRDRVNCCGESGLLGLAFHPEFVNNGEFFVDYINPRGETIIARYRTTPDRLLGLSDTEQVLLRIKQPTSIHNGGHLTFGPDGYLYIGTGDGGSFASGGDGSGNDPHNHAQRLDSLLGKILRIDINSEVVGASSVWDDYGIPDDNPFVNVIGARPEIWARGLKNPWRFSFDRLTGDLYIADVGVDQWEELNFQPAQSRGGENYGWRYLEGRNCVGLRRDCERGHFQMPVMVYSHDEGCAIIGGYVYRGTVSSSLQGQYIFGDYCSGMLWALEPGGTSRSGTDVGWRKSVLASTQLNISAFGEDEVGELYVIARDEAEGAVYRLDFLTE